MTVRVNKPSFNIREKLTEIKHKPVELISVNTSEIALSGATSKVIEGIHETDHPIYLHLNGTSIGTASNHQFIRFGTEKDGIKSSGIYYWQNSYAGNGQNVSAYSGSPGSEYHFQYGWNNPSNVFHTIIQIQRLHKANNTYFAKMIGVANSGYPTFFAQSCCRVELDAPLFSIDFFCDTAGGTTFDGGTISLQYIYERNL